LLAPAGDWDCVKAAVENGADAVYFGLDRFNARMRADNFTEADLPALMSFLHRRGLKGYLTFNILVFENELEEAEQYLRTIIAAGVDAAVVQDVGICRMIRRLSPDFPIHVSTQMTVTSAAGVEFARELGCQLVVLARECSLQEIAALQSAANGLPLEVFIHGALCVAYSGQCLTSEALGGRSANRGECAQACRLPYELVCDGQPVPLGDRQYLLSPRDLAGLEVLPDLVRLGVASLKIEGRLKRPEYVANITRIYRRALDSLASGHASTPGGEQDRQVRYEMEMAFSRGLHSGWFHGTNHQALVHARFGKKRGVYLGEVEEVRRQAVVTVLRGPLKRGDGVVFDAGNPELPEEGGRVYDIRPRRAGSDRGAGVVLEFGRGDIDFGRIQAGNKIWKTSDPELDRRLRQTFEGDTPRFRRPISVEVHGRAGEALTVVARDSLGHETRLASSMSLARAENQPLTTQTLREQLGRLGGTQFTLRELENRLAGRVLLPVSELNRLRRDMVRQLEALASQPPRWTLTVAEKPERPQGAAAPGTVQDRTPRLVVLVRDLAQLAAALESGIETLYCEFEDPRKYREAVSRFRSARGPAGGNIFVAPPRVFKPGEEATLSQVRSSAADGYLVRNYDHLRFFEADRKIGDYSLNIANHLAAQFFKERFNLERITASYDLNFGQLEALLLAVPPAWIEITVHQHMPMFHMEHCVFCAFLSTGTDYRNCGRPCDTCRLEVRDRAGAAHPVKADAGCRNTVFNALAQTGAEHVWRMLALGVRWLRIEFLNETPDQVARTIAKYAQLLRGEISGSALWRELKLLNQLGVTRGQMVARR
jgi:putative protease